jgi:flagellin
MALNINTNIGALGAAAAASSVNKSMESAMERLSTGLRINTAADDAAGMAISSRMEAQIRGLNMAIRNAADGQALIDTTEGAHNEVMNILQRMRELAVQSSNDTNVSGDRTNLQAEITQLIAEVDRIANQSTWNGVKILDGTFSAKQLQIGADEGQVVTFGVDSVSSSAIGSHVLDGWAQISTTSGGGILSDTYTVTGIDGSTTVTSAAGDSAKEFAARINNVTSTTGVSATAVTKVKLSALTAADTVTLTINGTSMGAVAVTDTSDLRGLRDAINSYSGTTGVTAAISSSNAALELTDIDGDDIRIDFETALTTTEMTLDVLDKNSSAATSHDGSTALSITLIDSGGTAAAGDANEVWVTGQVTFESRASFNIGVTNDSADFDTTTAGTIVADGEFVGNADGNAASTNSSSLSAVSAINIGTVGGSKSAIVVIDGAIEKINAARADLGAISNRLDNTISNLTNISTNVEASRGRIQDADFAAESTNLAKSQILQQASMAMLAQANASKQSVLSLLQS